MPTNPSTSSGTSESFATQASEKAGLAAFANLTTASFAANNTRPVTA